MGRPHRNLDYLPRVISKWGFCSRREAERLVVAGRVTVGGVVKLNVLAEVDPHSDRIEVDGRPIAPAARLHLKMHKPLGVVTTMKDPQGRRTVADLIPTHWRGAMPVGRLDQESTGLLLLTNDHSLGHGIAGPEHRVKKIYLVEVGQHPDDAMFTPIREGIELQGGDHCRPADVTIVERRERSTLLRFVLGEGKFRQIRRSLKAIGLRVRSLHRIAIGPIELGALAPGEITPLTEKELAALRAAVGSAGSERPARGERGGAQDERRGAP